jgi:hypothetical protein
MRGWYMESWYMDGERKPVEQLQARSKRQAEAAKKAAVQQNLTEIADKWAEELTPG